jgi:hypothetical protein
MEITCTRCRETLQADHRYCPGCGLPQLVYSVEAAPGQAQPARWNEGVRDASSVDWKPALRAAVMLAVPAGLFSSFLSPLSSLGMLWMASAAAWAVVLYVRSQRPAWITVGAGARIGLVTGIVGSWTAAAASGITLFAMRFFLNQGKVFDDLWQDTVKQLLTPDAIQQWASAGVDIKAWLLSPEGRAGSMLSGVLVLVVLLVLFAVAGGALGARWMARTRQPEV